MATDIQWTDETWSPVTGCTRVSAGCDNCYSARLTYRLEMMGQRKYTGLTVLNGKGHRHFNGVVKTHDSELTKPLGWRKPKRVFVNSMSDTFHRDVPFEFIDKIFAVAALCPHHTLQILTKRPERMAEYFADRTWGDVIASMRQQHEESAAFSRMWIAGHLTARYELDDVFSGTRQSNVTGDHYETRTPRLPQAWPLPNVWLGTSVEDQAAADERIPHLLRCPAAVRFLSVEPLLEAVELHLEGIHWVIVGGESGPGARPLNVEWVRSVVAQCKAAGVKVFVKQLGANVVDQCEECTPEYTGWPAVGSRINWETGDVKLKDKKGGDPSEWPIDLRVRQFPREAPNADDQ